MEDELLDLVDVNDQVVGTVTRAAAHRDPSLRHREVAIMLHDLQGRMLLCRRALSKPTNPGLWVCSAAGHVGAGESPQKAAHRELVEELRVETELALVGVVLVEEPNEAYFAYCFRGLLPAGADVRADPLEVAEWRLVSTDEASRLMPLDRASGAPLRLFLSSL